MLTLQSSEEAVASILRVEDDFEDRSSRFLQNICTHLPDYMHDTPEHHNINLLISRKTVTAGEVLF
jgi:hypothetical protein